MKDFFNFKTMISPTLIKIIYVIGAVGILFGSFAAADGISGFTGGGSAGGAFTALLLLILGELFWRIACENMILFFSMHDILSGSPDILSKIGSAKGAAAAQNRPQAPGRPPASTSRAPSAAARASSLNDADDPIITPPPWYCPKCKKRLTSRVCPTCKYKVP